jgi:uncharacterized protein (TIGR03086 family)
LTETMEPRRSAKPADGRIDEIGKERKMAEVKDFHQRALERYGQLVHAIRNDQWYDSTPCTEWDVRTLVQHLVFENLWMPPLLDGKTIADVGDSLEGDLLGADPKAAWDRSASEVGVAVRAVPLDRIVHLSYGDVPAEHYISEVFTDLAIHGWDLARAIGADETIDPEIVELLHSRFKPREDDLKASGLFGPKVVPPPGADKQTELLAVFGRVA